VNTNLMGSYLYIKVMLVDVNLVVARHICVEICVGVNVMCSIWGLFSDFTRYLYILVITYIFS